jgi:hypothetical protein
MPLFLTKEWRLLSDSAGRGIFVQLLYGETENGAKLATLSSKTLSPFSALLRHLQVPDRHASGPEKPLPDLI